MVFQTRSAARGQNGCDHKMSRTPPLHAKVLTASCADRASLAVMYYYDGSAASGLHRVRAAQLRYDAQIADAATAEMVCRRQWYTAYKHERACEHVIDYLSVTRHLNRFRKPFSPTHCTLADTEPRQANWLALLPSAAQSSSSQSSCAR
eukprot:TRINITY_DN5412_c0_g1_i6.p1 TRINITY_DN5412_c0_g1~~TRINITY_DN5412_c0_g1_i6.p1  ORF type:complete len:149 (+),score=0.44 TRINITY_DN5412_c0_g1_i6:291-737(+)